MADSDISKKYSQYGMVFYTEFEYES